MKTMNFAVKASVASAALALILAPVGVVAEEKPGLLSDIPGEFSANVGVTSQYLFRGLDQSDEMPALQGGIDYSVDTGLNNLGLYLGAWGSNVNFNDGNQASVELDGYGGVTGTVANIDWDLGVIYYAYPGASSALNYNFVEYKAALGYSVSENLDGGLSYSYSPDFFGASGKSHFVQATGSYAIPYFEKFDMSIDASAGRQWIEKNATYLQPDYWTWSLGLGLQLSKNLSASLTYVDTDIEEGACGGGGSDACDARAIFALTASF